MFIRGSNKGFALPTVLIASVIMLGVLMVSVTSAASIRVALSNQYYNQLSQNASDAGIAYAKYCLEQSGGIPKWTNEKPLSPGTDCSGDPLPGLDCSLIPINSKCVVFSYQESTQEPVTAEVLLVGGGGGGGSSYYGGGGGGGQFLATTTPIGDKNVSVLVGQGGAAGTTGRGFNGGDTVFGSLMAIGGGGGGGGTKTGDYSQTAGGSGASGGGGGDSGAAGTGTAGYNGGGGGVGFSGSGGGGAGAAGSGPPAIARGGSGGAGLSSSISGSLLWYAGGGGGAARDAVGVGGSGVGGNGALPSGNGQAGIRGGGGGGAGNLGVPGVGGPGLAIIKYPKGSITATGGSIVDTATHTIHTFTSNGTFQVGPIKMLSTFKVGLPILSSNGKSIRIASVGDLQLLKTTGEVWRSFKSNATHVANYSGYSTYGLTVNLDATHPESYPGSTTKTNNFCPSVPVSAEWTDITCNERNGILKNGAIYNSANGGSITFDGTNDYVQIGSLGDFYDQGTISFWMKPSAIENYRNPFSTKYNGTNAGIRFEETATGNFSVVVGNDAGTYTQGIYLSSGLTANTWYHIILTWDKVNNKIKGYLNGDMTPKFNLDNTYWPTKLPDVVVGSGHNTDAARYWKGSIASVRIYNRALSPVEVKMNYDATKARY